MKIILGYGKSGKAVAFILSRRGEKAIVNDIKKIENEKYENIEYVFGEHPLWLLNEAEEIIVSPGVPLNLELIKKAKEKNIKVISEIEWALNQIKGKKIGITGTNGKSTVTSLLAHLFNYYGKKATEAGNFGYPLSSFILNDVYSYYSIEISSFQLELMEEKNLDGAVLLNITEDHLDRHENFKNYKKIKKKIFEILKEDGIGVGPENLFEDLKIFRFGYGKDCDLIIKENFLIYENKIILERKDFKLLGTHNWENLAAALLLFLKLEGYKENLKDAVSSFKPLEHRMEIIPSKHGITFINDSKGTNVDSVLKALTGVPEKRTILILGGMDKGGDFYKLKNDIEKKCKAVFCIGMAGKKIFDCLKDLKLKVFLKENLKEVFENLKPLVEKGDFIMLSPACASFDQYKNFEERGKHFKELVKKWEEEEDLT